jgi:hypothetical protein
MPFSGNPSTSAIDRVRLMTGDILPDIEFLTDDIYQYVLTKNSDSEKQSALECARYILPSLARYARERAGDIEYYGSEFFRNYKEFLLLLIQNPHSGFIEAMPYAGGISQADIRANISNLDTPTNRFYKSYLPQEALKYSQGYFDICPL